MPPVIGIIAVGITDALAAVGVSYGTALALGAELAPILFGTGVSMLISGAASLIGGLLGGLNKSQGLTVASRNPNAPWRVVYGLTNIAGVCTFITTTGSQNAQIHMVFTLCAGKVHQVGTMYFDGTAIPIDPSTGNGQGQWAGYVFLETDVGDPANTSQPFPSLAGDCPGYWNSTCLQRGQAKAYVRLTWNSKLFASGVPNITFDIYGREVYDPRTATSAFSSNPALCIRDYLTDQNLGLMADAATEINDASVIAAANICDEAISVLGEVLSAAVVSGHAGSGYAAGDLVTVAGGNGDCTLWIAQTDSSGHVQNVNVVKPGSGYSNASNVACTGGSGSGFEVNITTFSGTEAQYTCNGVFETTAPCGQVLNDLSISMAGYVSYVQGQFNLMAGAYSAPTVSLGDDDFRAPLQVQSTLSRRDLFNSVHGSYLSEGNGWQATDYPAIINGTWVNQDGNILWYQLDLPFTTSAATCQRIANIMLQRCRRQIHVTAHCKLTAGMVQPGDTVEITHARFGWNAKTFFATDVNLVSDADQGDDPALGVDLLLVETDAGVYSWSTAQQQAAAPLVSAPAPQAGTVISNVVTYTGSADALAYPGSALLSPASGVDAATLATPVSGSDDSKEITITNGVAAANTVTTATGKIVDGTGVAKQVMTFAAQVGGSITLMAYGGLWYVQGAPLNVTLS